MSHQARRAESRAHHNTLIVRLYQTLLITRGARLESYLEPRWMTNKQTSALKIENKLTQLQRRDTS